MTKSCRIFVPLALCILCASAPMAQTHSSERLNVKSLEAAVSFAQSLAQWEFVLIGGSLLVLVGTSHRHPTSRLMRMAYLLFLPAWLCLCWSIYLGTQAQGVYLAYLLVPVTTLEGATQRLNEDIGNQIFWMSYGLVIFFIWLVQYLFWWIFSKRGTEGQSTS
jgi:hypothetical protein